MVSGSLLPGAPLHQPQPAARPTRRHNPALRLGLIGLAVAGFTLSSAGMARASCRPLMPIGGSGEPVVTKRISPDRLLGSTNWNTDFSVDRSFASYRFTFESASTERATFPVAGFMRFTDGTSLQVFNETLTLEPGASRSFGPFPSVGGKRSNKMNFRVGSSQMPAATGFSYRVSVEGCQ